MIDRHFLSHRYAKGLGLEIGAYHNPFPLHSGCRMHYLDKWPTEKMKEMALADKWVGTKPIVNVDVVDDGQWLKTVKDNSYDFLVSSHQIEHCESPLTAIENHVRVIKPGGIVIYAVPDKRFTFDQGRMETFYDHILKDYESECDQYYHYNQSIQHYNEYLLIVDQVQSEEERFKIAKERIGAGLDIHYHCWSMDSLMGMFLRFMDKSMFRYTFELSCRSGHENFVVLKKL